jgi:esterase/lipase superfamily enzyme
MSKPFPLRPACMKGLPTCAAALRFASKSGIAGNSNHAMTLLTRQAVNLLLIGVLSGCAARPDPGFPTPLTEHGEGATEHKVLVATTRERDMRPGVLFNGERSTKLNYASVTVSVPATHVAGDIEWPSTPLGDRNNSFVVRSASDLKDDREFVRDLNEELASRRLGARNVILFIHGYNTLFSGALYRLVQIDQDAGALYVPVLFSWASRGRLIDYIYDSNSAAAARDELAHILQLLFVSRAEHVNILAHSMGNWVAVEALRQLSIAGKLSKNDKVGFIFLAAPDIDLDVFKSQLRQFKEPRKRFYVILSKDDKALALSSFIAGGKARLGSDSDSADLAAVGATVIDLTDMASSDPANHDKFVQLAKIAPQLIGVLARGTYASESTVSRVQPEQGNISARSAPASLTISGRQVAIAPPR